MLKARLAGILRPLLPLRRVYAGLLTRPHRAVGAMEKLLLAAWHCGRRSRPWPTIAMRRVRRTWAEFA